MVSPFHFRLSCPLTERLETVTGGDGGQFGPSEAGPVTHRSILDDWTAENICQLAEILASPGARERPTRRGD